MTKWKGVRVSVKIRLQTKKPSVDTPGHFAKPSINQTSAFVVMIGLAAYLVIILIA